MNKKQLIVAWVIGILVCYICGFTLMSMFINAKMNPGVNYSGWQSFTLFLLPHLIIGSLLIYTLRQRRKRISEEIKTARKITIKQVLIVLVIMLAGLIIIFLSPEITNKPPWSMPAFLIMTIFYLTIISYPIYLALTFIQWIIKSTKK